jgi:PAS domain-containing protein
VAVAALLTGLCPFGPLFAFAVFTAAILLSVWHGGASSGLVATGLGTGLLLLFHIRQLSTETGDAEFFPRLVLFVLLGLLACYLSRLCGEAVRASEEVQLTLSTAGHALVLADATGRVTFANDLAQSLTGCKFAEALGQPCDRVCVLIDAATHQPLPLVLPEIMRDGQPSELPDAALLVSRDGQQIPVEGVIVPVPRGKNRPVGLALHFYPVPPHRLAQQAEWLREREILAQRAAELAAALKAAQDEHRQQLADSLAARQRAEESVQTGKQAMQRRLEEQSAEWERNEANWKQALSDLEKQLRERVAAQKQSEEAQQQARPAVERQLAEKDAQLQQVEEKARRAEADRQRQVQELESAWQQAELALEKAREDSDRQAAPHAAALRQAEEAARKEREEFQRQLSQQSATLQKAEDSFRTARAELERQRTERAEALQRAEATLERLRQEWSQTLEQERVARQHAEDALRQGRLEWERRLAERSEAARQAETALQALQEETARNKENYAHAVEVAERLQGDLQAQIQALRRENETLARLLQEERQAPHLNGQSTSSVSGSNRAPANPEPADWLSFN